MGDPEQKITIARVQPETYIMDNEVSRDLKDAPVKEHINYQLVSPHIHRENLAERAIRTFKNHFLVGLASVNPIFPWSEWDILIPQAVTSLNLLRSARANPKLSAYAYLFGQYDWNATPMVPPGTKVLAHDKPDNMRSWAFHGEKGRIIGPVSEHYRCMKVYFPSSRTVRNVDTVIFFLTLLLFQKLTSTITSDRQQPI